jgi:hypothetical protein
MKKSIDIIKKFDILRTVLLYAENVENRVFDKFIFIIIMILI